MIVNLIQGVIMRNDIYWLNNLKELTSLVSYQFKLSKDWDDDVKSEITLILLELHDRDFTTVKFVKDLNYFSLIKVEKSKLGMDKFCYLKPILFSEVLEKIRPKIIKMLNGYSNNAEYDLKRQVQIEKEIKARNKGKVLNWQEQLNESKEIENAVREYKCPNTVSGTYKYEEEGSSHLGSNEGVFGELDGQKILDFNDTMRIIDVELKKLPYTHQKVLKMLWEGYNMEEIEKTLNINRVTAWRINERFQEVMNQKRQKGEM